LSAVPTVILADCAASDLSATSSAACGSCALAGGTYFCGRPSGSLLIKLRGESAIRADQLCRSVSSTSSSARASSPLSAVSHQVDLAAADAALDLT